MIFCDSKPNSVGRRYVLLVTLLCNTRKAANHRIVFFSDKSAVVDVINKQTAKDGSLMDIVQELDVQCVSHNICFRAKHILGKTNMVADHLY